MTFSSFIFLQYFLLHFNFCEIYDENRIQDFFSMPFYDVVQLSCAVLFRMSSIFLLDARYYYVLCHGMFRYCFLPLRNLIEVSGTDLSYFWINLTL